MVKTIAFYLGLSLSTLAQAQACLSDYPPARLSQGTVANVHPGIVFVEPPYAGFDPCNSTVELRLNENSDTLVLVLHGSGGSDASQTNVARRYQMAGYSVLYFDAFRINKIQRDHLFWSTAVHAGSTSRMLYFSAKAAVEWLGQHHPQRSRKIIVHGFSMGAQAAINLAATEGLRALTQVIAEAPANAGMGLPDQLLKPVHVFYGAQDNFGGLAVDEFLWKRRSPCLWNAPIENTPAGNTALCSYAHFVRGQRTQTVEDYVDEQKRKGAPISLQFFEGAGHGIFNGRDIETGSRVTPSGIRFYTTVGARAGVADQVFQDVLARLK